MLVKDCQHERLQFGSGDYYIFCHACGSSWMRRKNGKAEYGSLADGKPVGGAPEEANQGMGGTLSGEFRLKRGLKE